MTYDLTVTKRFQAKQGLRSPIRASRGLLSLQPDDAYAINLTVGIIFVDTQLNAKGWFVDTDSWMRSWV